MSTVIDGLSLAYSKNREGSVKITKNFTVREFSCQDGSDPVFIHPLIPVICQAVRNWFGYAFTPNSAYRTLTHNKAEGGAVGSFHVYGKAVDIPSGGKATPDDLYNFLDKLCGDSCEIGLYSWGVHVGITDTKKRFKG